MKRVFFIVGPTAVGKSEIAAEVAQRLRADVLSADAFQIYRGLDVLTAKPAAATLAKALHHLIGAVPLRRTAFFSSANVPTSTRGSTNASKKCSRRALSKKSALRKISVRPQKKLWAFAKSRR